jgi:hypothetical protein
MDEAPTKNRKRAMRRKRNFIAKDLILNKQFRPKRVEPKKKRQRITVKQVEEFISSEEL